MYGFVNENGWRKLQDLKNYRETIKKNVSTVLSQLADYAEGEPVKSEFNVKIGNIESDIISFKSCFGEGRLVFSYSAATENVEGRLIFQREILNENDERIWEETLCLHFPPFENPYGLSDNKQRVVIPVDRMDFSRRDFDFQCFAFLMSILHTQLNGAPHSEGQSCKSEG